MALPISLLADLKFIGRGKIVSSHLLRLDIVSALYCSWNDARIRLHHPSRLRTLDW